MKRLSAKQGVLIFYAFDAVLVFVLALAFLPLNKKKSLSSMDTALLNPNNVSSVAQIKISQPVEQNSPLQKDMQTVRLFKSGRVWLGIDESSGLENPFVWPADTSNVAGLIAEAAKIQKVFLASSKVTSWNDFCVDKDSASEVTFLDKDGAILSSLFFGKENKLSGRIYFRSWESGDVYECSSSFSSFLSGSASPSFWSDPFIYPQCVTEYSRQKSDSLLRHGHLEDISPAMHLKPDFVFSKDFENGSLAKFSIYKKDEAFIVIPLFVPGPAFGDEEKKAVASINYRYSISPSTFEKLKKEFSNE
ncbi:MAG: DUF4340 domain-containing protein [Treponema sp.]|nr:DUF4340 domain-containing protein [Treponema sp.]